MYAISLSSEQDFLLAEEGSFGITFCKDIMKARLFGTKGEAELCARKNINTIRTRVISMIDAEISYELFEHLCKFQLHYLQSSGKQLSLSVRKERECFFAEYSVNGMMPCTKIVYFTNTGHVLSNSKRTSLLYALLNIKRDYIKALSGWR